MKLCLSRISLPLVFALLAVSAMAPSRTLAANLLANPGFETSGGSYSGWFTFGSGPHISTPGTDNIAHSGSAAAKIYGGFNGCPGSPAFNVGGFGQAFTPTVGSTYEFSGYAFISSLDPMLGTNTCVRNRVIAKVVFFNAVSGGAELASNEVIIADGHGSTDQWRAFSVSAPAPSGALRVEALILFLQPGCETGSAFVDDVSLTETVVAPGSNVLANPSFSPGLTGWNTFGNVIAESRAFGTRTPSGSAKMFSTFVAGSPSGMYQAFPATPGSKWQLQAYSLMTCQENPISEINDNFVTEKLVFKDASSVEIATAEAVIVNGFSPLGTWTNHSIATTAPVNTATVEAYILFNSPSLLSGAAWIDDVQLQTGPAVVAVAPTAGQFKLELSRILPNPFRAGVRIDFSVPRGDDADLSVFDMSGRRVAQVLHAHLAAGSHSVSWDGRNSSGAAAAGGIYRCVLRTSTGTVSRNMVRVK